MLDIDKSIVLIIDVQEKLLNAVFNKDLCAKKSAIIADAADILDIPIIVTEQYPKGLGSTVGISLNRAKCFEKTSFSAFETVKNALSEKRQVVIFGIETHICVSQTVESLVREGYEVYVVKDACGSRSEEEYIAGLERMKDNGAHILTAEIALFEWLKSSKHPKFKEVQMLIK